MKRAEMLARALELKLGTSEELEALKDDKLVALLKENDPTFTPDQPKGAAAKASVKRADDDPRTGKLVKCRIEATSDPDGKFDVYACVNGYNIQAKRNTVIELDEGFVKHLQSIYITDTEAEVIDGKATGKVIETPRPRFPITLL